jgi:hypothetical protein
VQHRCCGAHVRINDTVRFKLTMVEIVGEEKELQMAMKAVVVWDGTELCTVGFLGKNIVALEETSSRYQDKFAQIIELYDESDNQTKRVRSNHNLGVASFRLFDDIQFKSKWILNGAFLNTKVQKSWLNKNDRFNTY